jgi:putative transcriptional regulator
MMSKRQMSKMLLEPIKGRILLSEPFLSDPNFLRSVVLLTEHSHEGTVGFVLNQPLDLSINDVILEKDLPEIPLLKGGPVQLDTLHFVHGLGDKIPESKVIKTGLWWGGSFGHALDLIRLEPKLHKHFKFFLGYSGWAPDQLAGELERESWVVSEISNSQVLNPKLESEKLWKEAMHRLGGNYRILSNSPIDPQLN